MLGHELVYTAGVLEVLMVMVDATECRGWPVIGESELSKSTTSRGYAY